MEDVNKSIASIKVRELLEEIRYDLNQQLQIKLWFNDYVRTNQRYSLIYMETYRVKSSKWVL